MTIVLRLGNGLATALCGGDYARGNLECQENEESSDCE